MISCIERVLEFVRETKKESYGFGDQIMFFIAFLVIVVGIGLSGYLLVMLPFTFPKVFIPIYFTIFVLWKGYQRI